MNETGNWLFHTPDRILLRQVQPMHRFSVVWLLSRKMVLVVACRGFTRGVSEKVDIKTTYGEWDTPIVYSI